MSVHINRYIDKIKMFESKQSKQFTMTMREAKDLHGDITKLLLALQELQKGAEDDDDKPRSIEVSGGSW